MSRGKSRLAAQEQATAALQSSELPQFDLFCSAGAGSAPSGGKGLAKRLEAAERGDTAELTMP